MGPMTPAPELGNPARVCALTDRPGMSPEAPTTPAPTASMQRDHPAIGKLEVLKRRLRDLIDEDLDREQFDRAIERIHRLRGVDTSIDCLLSPDAAFSEP